MNRYSGLGGLLMSTRFFAVLTVGVLAAALGCSSGSSSPTAPGLTGSKSVSAKPMNSTSLLGYWEIVLDPDTGSADIVPLRMVEFTANVVQFMQPPSSPNHKMSVSIDSGLSDMSTGYVVVDIGFTHPFLGLDQFTGFDVRGVCIGDGSVQGTADPGILYAGADDMRVLNADGLTRWFNPSEFTTYGTIFGFTIGALGVPTYDCTATLNGYKYYCDDLDKEDDVVEFFADPSCPNPRGLFSAGNTIIRRFELQFPLVGGAPKFVFQYAVVASWEPPDPNPPENVPDDFCLSANCHEAYAVSTNDQSTLYYVDPSTNGGELILEVAVFDHQGVQNSAGVHEEIARIHLETQTGLIVGNLATFEAADLTSALIESNELLARYRLVVPESGVEPKISGDVDVMVVVESAAPDSYDQDFPGFEFPDGALAGYRITSVHVGDINPNEPPVAIADTVSGTYQAYMSVPVAFDGSDSYDPDGTIVSYEWEADGDDLYDDASGPNPDITFDEAGVFFVDLKVTDNEGAWDTLDDPIEITVLDKVIHVDDDNTAGPWDGTEAHPYETIQDGLDAVPDDTGWMVYVHEGLYDDPLTLENPGDPQNSPGGVAFLSGLQNVTLQGEDGATIDPPFNLTFQKAAIRLRANCQNIVIDNFIIDPTYAYQSAIWAEGGSDFEVKNCSLEPPSASYGFLEFVRTRSTNNVTVSNNEMDTFNSASTFMSVFVISGGSNITITENDVYKLNNWVGHNLHQTGEGYVWFYNVSGGEISKNKLGGDHHRSCSSTNYVQSYAVKISNGSDIEIRNNLIYDTYFRNTSGSSQNWGILVDGSASNIEVFHNTIDRVGPPSTYGGTGWTYGIGVTNSNSQTIHSNIVTNIQATSLALAYGIYTTASQASDYGCVWSVNGGAGGGLYGGGAYAGTGSISADPLYQDSANFDYTLASGSPCIGAGMDGEDMGCYGGSDPLDW